VADAELPAGNRREPGLPAGVFYVATEHARFVTGALRSAESLRRVMPDVHVTLFTDREVKPEDTRGLFDRVESLPFAEDLGTSWGSGLLGKVRAFGLSPYVKSLYLDTDTRVLRPSVGDIFRLLDECEWACAACEPGESRNQRLSGRPMFNSGVVAFRACPRVARLLDAWLERQEAHAAAIRDRRLDQFEYVRHIQGPEKVFQLVADQTALARFLSPEVNVFGVDLRVLPRIWNWRPDHIVPEYLDQVVIHHADVHKAA
jgi:hypothetical protein